MKLCNLRQCLLAMAALGCSVTLIAAPQTNVTPPGQPTTGPGGSTYPYPAVVQSGPYSAAPGSLTASPLYDIYQPSGTTLPASLPVVLFLEGDLLSQEPRAGNSPANYVAWIRHITKMGYTVVFPRYDGGVGPGQFASNIMACWQAALSRLNAGGLIPPTLDSLGLQIGFVGHSLGAVEALTVAEMLTASGVPSARVIAAFTPGLGKSNLPIDFHDFAPNTKLVLVFGDADTSEDIATAQIIWQSATAILPPWNREFLEVISDAHGSPDQIGNHWFPLTSGLNDTAAVDDRDYNVTWKLSAGLLDCAFAGTNCSYVLSHGGTLETDMGLWSDGTPVTPLQAMP